jgi:hypothetical protein
MRLTPRSYPSGPRSHQSDGAFALERFRYTGPVSEDHFEIDQFAIAIPSPAYYRLAGRRALTQQFISTFIHSVTLPTEIYRLPQLTRKVLSQNTRR